MADPIALRCYVDHEEEKKAEYKQFSNEITSNKSMVLVFDTETTIDEYQNLLFGSCGKWVNGSLSEFYIFYNEHIVKQNEIEIIKAYCQRENFKLLTRTEFVEQIFYPYVYQARARCVCFNIPFDISRLAISFTKSRKFHNGFSFKLSTNPKHPNVIVKSLNTKASFIEFTRPLRRKSERKKNYNHYKGYFIDLKTATFGLTHLSHSLDSALEAFGCNLSKIKDVKHGIISEEYLQYNVNDTNATYQLYTKVLERYSLYRLEKEINKIYSPASIGKAYLEKIGIKPFFEKNPDFPKELLGKVMSTYYGGRTEVRIRKTPVKVAYLDFTSMYPTVYTLLGMDKLLKSDKIRFSDSTQETQCLLDNIAIDGILNKELWRKFNTICRIKPDNDILPIRSQYDSKHTYNIGLNYLKSEDDTSLWYTLPDLIASKFLSGKTPKIEEAISFYPSEIQQGLKPIEILNGITVKPEEDFIKRLIEERIRIRKEGKGSNVDKNQIKLKQYILKIIANSVSYGIYIEINTVDNGDDTKQNVTIFGLDRFKTSVTKVEREGRAFNPIMAAFITASARLLIATAEALVYQNNGSFAYCDTDSVFISYEQVNLVQKFFKPLNPYAEDIEVFKVEEDEYGNLDNVWFYGISAKRYVLYDLDEKSNDIRIRKYSSHGLGHLQRIDEKQWWLDILDIHYNPISIKRVLAKYQNQYAFSQLTISHYSIMQRFTALNEGKELKKMLKPFNFITVGNGYRQDPNTKEPIIPMLPYVNPKRAREIPHTPFIDYKSGSRYPNENSMAPIFYWRSLSEVFEDYINHSESKSEGDIGILKKKTVSISKLSIQYIGKESNDIDQSEAIGVTQDRYTKYLNGSQEVEAIKKLILSIPYSYASEYGLSERYVQILKRKIRLQKPLRFKSKIIQRLRKCVVA